MQLQTAKFPSGILWSSDLIIGQTHLLPVKTIICSSRSARAPVQISEAANRFLPAASVGFETTSVETSRGSEDTGNAADGPGVKPAIWSPRGGRCAQQSIICRCVNVFRCEDLLHLSRVRGHCGHMLKLTAHSSLLCFCCSRLLCNTFPYLFLHASPVLLC